MNGQVFAGLNNLKGVYLKNLQCMDDQFYTSTAIATMSRTVTEKCGFVQAVLCVNESSDDIREMLKALINRTDAEREQCDRNLITVAKVEAQLALATSELAQLKSELENQIILLKKKLEDKDEEILHLHQRFTSD